MSIHTIDISTIENDIVFRFEGRQDQVIVLNNENMLVQGDEDKFKLMFQDTDEEKIPFVFEFSDQYVQFYSTHQWDIERFTSVRKSRSEINRAYSLVEMLNSKQFSQIIPKEWNKQIFNELIRYSTNEYEEIDEELCEKVYQLENLPENIVNLTILT